MYGENYSTKNNNIKTTDTSYYNNCNIMMILMKVKIIMIMITATIIIIMIIIIIIIIMMIMIITITMMMIIIKINQLLPFMPLQVHCLSVCHLHKLGVPIQQTFNSCT